MQFDDKSEMQDATKYTDANALTVICNYAHILGLFWTWTLGRPFTDVCFSWP